METELSSTKRTQKLLLLAAALYPLWWFAFEMAVPSAQDSLIQRFVFSLLCLGVFAASHQVARAREHLDSIFYGVIWVATAHTFYFAYLNHAHPVYVLFVLVVVFCASMCFDARRPLVSYLAYALALSFAIHDTEALVSPWFIEGAIATVAIVSFVATNDKLKLLEMARRGHAENLKMADKLQAQELKLIHTEKMSTLGEVAGGVAHEVNNPLAIIKGNADQLRNLGRNGKATPETIEHHTSRISKTVDRIAKIIHGLRAIARDASNDPFLATDVNVIVRETLDFCEARLRDGGIAVTVECPTQALCAECRSIQISQILLNILNNAFDATIGQKEAWVKLSVTELKDTIEIRIANGGPTIPEDRRDKIFQPFFTTKDIGKGTGLGLSIARAIATAHKGSLTLDATPNTCFVLSLPKVQVGTEADTPKQAA